MASATSVFGGGPPHAASAAQAGEKLRLGSQEPVGPHKAQQAQQQGRHEQQFQQRQHKADRPRPVIRRESRVVVMQPMETEVGMEAPAGDMDPAADAALAGILSEGSPVGAALRAMMDPYGQVSLRPDDLVPGKFGHTIGPLAQEVPVDVDDGGGEGGGGRPHAASAPSVGGNMPREESHDGRARAGPVAADAVSTREASGYEVAAKDRTASRETAAPGHKEAARDHQADLGPSGQRPDAAADGGRPNVAAGSLPAQVQAEQSEDGDGRGGGDTRGIADADHGGGGDRVSEASGGAAEKGAALARPMSRRQRAEGQPGDRRGGDGDGDGGGRGGGGGAAAADAGEDAAETGGRQYGARDEPTASPATVWKHSSVGASKEGSVDAPAVAAPSATPAGAPPAVAVASPPPSTVGSADERKPLAKVDWEEQEAAMQAEIAKDAAQRDGIGIGQGRSTGAPPSAGAKEASATATADEDAEGDDEQKPGETRARKAPSRPAPADGGNVYLATLLMLLISGVLAFVAWQTREKEDQLPVSALAAAATTATAAAVASQAEASRVHASQEPEQPHEQQRQAQQPQQQLQQSQQLPEATPSPRGTQNKTGYQRSRHPAASQQVPTDATGGGANGSDETDDHEARNMPGQAYRLA